MKKLLIISIMSVFLTFLFVPTGFSYSIDGDVDDWGVDLTASGTDKEGYLDKNTNLPSGGNDIDYITEDNADKYGSGYRYVGPGYSIENTYDAEAMYFDNNDTYGYIAIITGTPINAEYEPGDIAIDVIDGGEYGYEYGIGLDSHLYNVSDWNDVLYYDEADPWTIATESAIDMGTVELFYNYVDNDHYVIEARFLLADLGLVVGDTFNIHWTMECGNDVLNLKADINPVPEPSTMLLLGFGLIGLGGIGRTRFLKRNQREEDKG